MLLVKVSYIFRYSYDLYLVGFNFIDYTFLAVFTTEAIILLVYIKRIFCKPKSMKLKPLDENPPNIWIIKNALLLMGAES